VKRILEQCQFCLKVAEKETFGPSAECLSCGGGWEQYEGGYQLTDDHFTILNAHYQIQNTIKKKGRLKFGRKATRLKMPLSVTPTVSDNQFKHKNHRRPW